MRATNQGGSLAGFIIIGVLLALVLIGGLYGLNRYNAQRAADETVAEEEKKTATNDAPKESSDESKTDTTKTDTEDQAATDRSRTNDDAPATPAPTGTPSANGQLPQTGPADTILSIFALSALTFVGVHYARSRSHA